MWQTIITILIVVVAAFVVLRRIWNAFKALNSKEDVCGGCAFGDAAMKKHNLQESKHN